MGAKIGKIIYALLIAAVIGWYFYDVFVNGASYTDNLLRTLCIICAAVAALLRGGKRYSKGLKFYENAYAAQIKNAFIEDAPARKKLLEGYRAYSENKLRKAENITKKLKGRCLSNADRESVYLLAGLVHTNMGLAETAISEYEELLARGVVSTTIYNNLGQQYARCGHRDRALECYEAAVSRDPGYAVGYNNIAQLYFRDGELDVAKSFAEKSLEADKSCYQAATLLAIIYAIGGDKTACERYSHMAISNGQNPTDLKNAIANFKSIYAED